jgi:hypothetical protein
MAAQPNRSVLAFRIIVAVLALIPIGAGAAGMVYGLSFPGFDVSVANPDAQSHFRFLSGVFFAMGLAYWSVALGIGNWLQRFQLLAMLTIVGGLARLVSLASDGAPSIGHQIGLGMELIAVPLLLVWSVRLRRPHMRHR